MTAPESAAVAVELERLRGVMSTGFAELRGELRAALQRTDSAEEDLRDLAGRVGALERARWTATGVVLGAAALLGGGAGYLAQALGG